RDEHPGVLWLGIFALYGFARHALGNARYRESAPCGDCSGRRDYILTATRSQTPLRIVCGRAVRVRVLYRGYRDRNEHSQLVGERHSDRAAGKGVLLEAD